MSHDVLVFCTVFAISYVWHGLGVTVGYHRLLTHRSFACPKWLEYQFALAGYLALQGSPLWWVTMHRAHHRYQDTPLDPHTPTRGLWYAYGGWITQKQYPSHINPALQTKDMIDDPLYSFLDRGGDWHQAYLLLLVNFIAFRLVIWALLGPVAALASLAAGIIILQIPLILNVACHMPSLGYKTYNTRDNSVNVWWVSLLGFGEGWHNNHHASPGSARTGMKPFEFDVSWGTILLLKRLGLVSKINEVTPAQLMMMENARKKQDIPHVEFATEFATRKAKSTRVAAHTARVARKVSSRVSSR
ncbi:MAG: acyl-CoA desaturase [Candidatus Melainabacteria bacterium]|nr:acyl-CoA desaturase [Candidatus Melainabacteria bacterium]